MTEPLFIGKDRELPVTQNFAALRELGMEYIRALSGSHWTDHNLHDPGITALEALCYALTDISYRTNFAIRDLLADPSNSDSPPEESGLFPAHAILPTSPLTIADYRKLLLKLRNVRNAWLRPLGPDDPRDVPVFVDADEQALSFQPVSASGANRPVSIGGLYRVRVEFEIDDEFGALNDPWYTHRVVEHPPLAGVILDVGCKDPRFVDGSLAFDRHITSIASVGPIHAVTGLFERLAPLFETTVRVRLSGGSQVTLDKVFVRVTDAKPDANPDALPIDVSPAGLRIVLESDRGPVQRLWEKHRRIHTALADVACVLNANRNLGEDFESVRAVAAQRLGICADIVVEPDADMELVQARVVHAIETHLNPPVDFYSLQEMLDRGLSPSEIFNGPYVDYTFECNGERVFTKPGFVMDTDLDATELKSTVHVSDIINIVMDVPDVTAISNVRLRGYDEFGEALGAGEKWCLTVAHLHQPLLDFNASKLLFFKNAIPFKARRKEFERTLAQLRGIARREAFVDPDESLGVPKGEFRNPAEFFPVQHDFPFAYGIGKAGLSKHEVRSRIAKSRQFKAYLTVFEQMIADHLAQLANLRSLLSLKVSDPVDPHDPSQGTRLIESWRAQPVGYGGQGDEIRRAAIAGVIRDFVDEMYLGRDQKTALEALPESPPEGDEEPDEQLLEDKRLEILKYVRDRVFGEDADRTAVRRNRVLDHLLARFAETFTEFALAELDRTVTPKQTAESKARLARNYPKLSRERALGINYMAEGHWDTDSNISGLKHRVAQLLGIEDLRRRNLHCDDVIEALFDTRKIGDRFRLEIKDEDQVLIFKSKQRFATREAALTAARTIYPALHDVDSYDKEALDDNRVVIVGATLTLEHEDQFVERADAIGTIYDLVSRHAELLQSRELCNEEGFHVIEHVLLRPRSTADPLMTPCFGDDGEICEADPYSFRVSVILPYWLHRFRDPERRAVVERTLREECPAHVYLKICWIANHKMMELDAAYERWLGSFTDGRATEDSRRVHLGELIDVLLDLDNVYPAATLHDCDEDGDERDIVRLDHTSLGPL
jgi:hypothetical protein